MARRRYNRVWNPVTASWLGLVLALLGLASNAHDGDTVGVVLWTAITVAAVWSIRLWRRLGRRSS